MDIPWTIPKNAGNCVLVATSLHSGRPTMTATSFSVDNRTGFWLMKVDASASVGRVSAGSAPWDKVALGGIPFFACSLSRLAVSKDA